MNGTSRHRCLEYRVGGHIGQELEDEIGAADLRDVFQVDSAHYTPSCRRHPLMSVLECVVTQQQV